MAKILLIGFAGFTGTLGRYWLSGVVARRYGCAKYGRFKCAGLALGVARIHLSQSSLGSYKRIVYIRFKNLGLPWGSPL